MSIMNVNLVVVFNESSVIYPLQKYNFILHETMWTFVYGFINGIDMSVQTTFLI
jgi:hypothetical protein